MEDLTEPIFGMDPVDFNHRDEHVKQYRSVSVFILFPFGEFTRSFDNDKIIYIRFCCSWKYDLLVRRFLALLGLSYVFKNQLIDSKLSRFSLQKIFDFLVKSGCKIDDRFKKIDWNSITEEGIIKFRKCKKRKS